MTAYSIRIPDWHPATVNQLLRGRWWAAKLKKIDRQMIGAYAQAVPRAEGKRQVDFTIVLKKGQRAADNDAYHKSLMDGLVHAGMLKDDNRQWSQISQPQFERAERIATLITLRDI